MASSLKRLLAYWRETFSAAQEKSDMVLLILSNVLVLGGVVGQILGFITEPSVAQWTELVGGVVFISWVVWHPFRRHEKLNAELAEMRERLRSKLKVDCGPNVEDSVTRITRVPVVQNRVLVGEFTARYYRLKVETDGVAIVTNCRADLTRIEQDGTRVWGGDEAILTFAPGEQPDTTAKTIRDKIPGWVDIIYIQNKEVAIPAVVGRNWRYGQVFKTLGEYVLTVVLSADDMPSMEIHLKFKWTGNWDTSELVLIPENAVPGSVTEASYTVVSE